MEEVFSILAQLALAVIVVPVLLYSVARLWSSAYFRSREDHIRKMQNRSSSNGTGKEK